MIRERGRSSGGGGGRWRWRYVGGDRRKESEAAERDGGEVGIADGDGRVNVLALALGHGKLRPTTQGSSSLLCTERAEERNAQGRRREMAGPRGGRSARRREDSTWKTDGPRGHRKGENEMKSVFFGSSSFARAQCTLRCSKRKACPFLRASLRICESSVSPFYLLRLFTFLLYLGNSYKRAL